MRIAVLHQELAADAAVDELDVLVQVDAVEASLRRGGHEVERVAVSLDLGALRDALARIAPDVAFNLVETLGGTGQLCPAVPAMLAADGYAFTGADAIAMAVTTDKRATKRWLEAAGIAVPSTRGPEAARYVVKPANEDASIGIEVVSGRAAAEAKARGGRIFERYIEGRELAVAAFGDDDPVILPPSEIRFTGDWTERPRIVGYAAKWTPGTFEYDNTVRSFDFSGYDGPLLDRVRSIAKDCWRALDLSGYARVDLRVDEDGTPWVLEVNANPCLSPDAGFAAALAAGGIGYDDVIARLVAVAMERRGS